MTMHEATIEGVGVMAGQGPAAPVVLIEAHDEIIPMFVSMSQVQSIGRALHNRPPERPLTHDLLVRMVMDGGGAFDEVRIDDLDNGTFYAKIDIEFYRSGEAEKMVFDARPSDGIALAVRVDCQVMIAESVVDEAGIDRSELNEGAEFERSTDRFRIDDDEELQ